jgi:hypothetical protein
VRFGDVLVLSDGSLVVVCAPESGTRQAACLELDERGNLALCGEGPEVVLAGWDAIAQVVGSREELAPELRSAIESYRG